VKNIIHFEIPFQDYEQYHAGPTKHAAGRRLHMSGIYLLCCCFAYSEKKGLKMKRAFSRFIINLL